MSRDGDRYDVDLVPQLLGYAVAAGRAYNAGFPLVVLARDFVELGVPELAVEVALDAERERTEQPAAFWFAELACLHGMVGRRDDVERLVSKAEAVLGEDMRPCATLAVAFESLGDLARADEYLARVRAPDRDSALAEMVEISVSNARFERAEQLVDRPELRASWFRPRLAELRLAIARGHMRIDDRAAAMRWLDRAAELLGPPKDYQPNVEIAVAAAELGDAPRALLLARAVDRATLNRRDPYSSAQSLGLARAFSAAGDRKKVDRILDGYVAFYGQNTALGFAEAALACGQLGRERGVAKLLREAEARLATSNTLDTSRSALARAYAANGQLAPAIIHATAITDSQSRAATLVHLARLARARSVEMTPELTAAMQTLGATAG